MRFQSLKDYQECYASLPEGLKAALGSFIRVGNVQKSDYASPSANRVTSRLRGVLAIQRVILSKPLQDKVQQWHKDINLFFQNTCFEHGHDGSGLTSLYWRKANRSEYTEVETIHDRFDTLELYKIATVTGYYHGKSWKNGGLREFTGPINELTKGDHTTEEKEKNLEKWIAAGRSYKQWIDCLTKLDTNESSRSEDDSGAETPQLKITTNDTSVNDR